MVCDSMTTVQITKGNFHESAKSTHHRGESVGKITVNVGDAATSVGATTTTASATTGQLPPLPQYVPRPGALKPSKSSVYLTDAQYERHFTVQGRSTLFARLKSFLPPVDFSVVTFCLVWYAMSAISSNITKKILIEFPYPTTLTEVQFLISSMFCIGTMWVINNQRWLVKYFPQGSVPTMDQFEKNGAVSTWNLVKPNEKVLKTTIPMGMFQFVGHITSHQATSVIPVSLVHSVKALSPLTTVLAYRVGFKVQYRTVTYLTLIPLMVGVILTCFGNYKSKNNNEEGFYKGLFFALISMAIFVSQNIYAKQILTWKDEKALPTQQRPKAETKIDKITILLYCSLIGFVLTLPVFTITELLNYGDVGCTICKMNAKIISLFLLHGGSHFLQAMLAFHLIGLVSPVNYSVANIMKRIVVILFALLMERTSVNGVQCCGLLLTMTGLYLYDRFGSKRV